MYQEQNFFENIQKIFNILSVSIVIYFIHITTSCFYGIKSLCVIVQNSVLCNRRKCYCYLETCLKIQSKHRQEELKQLQWFSEGRTCSMMSMSFQMGSYPRPKVLFIFFSPQKRNKCIHAITSTVHEQLKLIYHV